MSDISINPVTRRVQYTGNTGLGPFAFTFNILADTDIVAYKNSTLLTLTTDYTVTINANGTGSITLTGSGNGTALVSADILTIIGGRELSRTTDFVTAGDLLASSLNEQLDSQVIMVQQLDEKVERTMRVSPDDIYNDMTLPLKTSRAGKTLAFDSNGDPTVGEDIGNWRGDWAAGTTYTVRDLVKDTANYNIYRCNAAHVSSGVSPILSNADSAKWDLVIDATAVADAQAAQAAAEAAQAAAETAETNAAASASAAATSQSSAATSATNSANSATAAATSETNAAASETAAAGSASAASTSATNAATSASAASTSASNAASSATAASTSATSASGSASAASTSASNAASSASAASSSASSASTSATASAASAAAASSSESAAAASAVSAASSAATAATLLDNFDDRYLGAKASDPALDNDGDPLVIGALYFNTTDGVMKIYTSSGWIAASSASVGTLQTFEYVATSGQTTFTGADANGISLSYTAPAIIVTLNGVRLRPGDDYTATDGVNVVLVSGATTGDELVIDAFGNFLVADTVSRSAGGTFQAAIAVLGNVDATSFTQSGAPLEAGAKEGIFWENGQTVTANYTITSGKNAGTFGPITINSGVTVTVPTGSRWVIV